MSTGKGNTIRRDAAQPAGNVHTCHETIAAGMTPAQATERCPRCVTLARFTR